MGVLHWDDCIGIALEFALELHWDLDSVVFRWVYPGLHGIIRRLDCFELMS